MSLTVPNQPGTVPIRALRQSITQESIDLPPVSPEDETFDLSAKPRAAVAGSDDSSTSTTDAPTHRLHLCVTHGEKPGIIFPLRLGANLIGRAMDEKVQIDLAEQEPPERQWASRKHAVINLNYNRLEIEDLKSRNGTFVNGQRLAPGSTKALKVNDLIQIGAVCMQLEVISAR